MNVVVLVEHLDVRRGGLERWAVQFVRWLCANGHRVCVVALSAPPDALPAEAEFHALPNDVGRWERARAAAHIINGLNGELVYDLGVGCGADILHPQYGSRVACHAAEVRAQPLWRRMWKAVSPVARRRRAAMAAFEDAQFRAFRGLLISPSQLVAASLIQRYGLEAEQVRVIYNGVDPDRFRSDRLEPLRAETRTRHGLAADQVVFVQVAINYRLKGVDTALRAMAHLPDRARLIVVGGGDASYFERLARTLGVTDRIRFTQHAPDPLPWIAAADAMVHPTRYDAGSLSVLEGWAAGLPVITTRANGNGELLTPGREGYLVDDPEDVDALVWGMTRLLDADTRRSMTLPARNLAARHLFEEQFKTIAETCQAWIDSGRATGRLRTPDAVTS